MTKSGGCKASAKRRLFVGQASGVLGAVILSTTAAFAGAWEEFQARCLVPYENQNPAIVDGLEPSTSTDAETRFLIEKTGDALSYLGVEHEPEDGTSACYVQERPTQSLAAFSAWIKKMVETERYIKTDDNVWSSALWIEPVLEIHLIEDGDELVIRIVETELET